jgi:hypothetical protein
MWRASTAAGSGATCPRAVCWRARTSTSSPPASAARPGFIAPRARPSSLRSARPRLRRHSDRGLWAYPERFAAARIAALAFDYRHFGDSDGEPRQLLDIGRQLEDWRAALVFVRSLEDELAMTSPDALPGYEAMYEGGVYRCGTGWAPGGGLPSGVVGAEGSLPVAGLARRARRDNASRAGGTDGSASAARGAGELSDRPLRRPSWRLVRARDRRPGRVPSRHLLGVEAPTVAAPGYAHRR